MENAELLQRVLNQTIERMAKQTAQHESEIANFNAQIILLQEQLNDKIDVSGKNIDNS